MAEEYSLFKSFLTCSECYEIIKDPVSLDCHHSFCSSGLQAFWDQAKHKNCPTCERRSSENKPHIHPSLTELADSNPGRGSDSNYGRSWRSQQQQAQRLEEQPTPDLMSVQDRKKKFQELEKTYDDMVPHLNKQLLKTERQIGAQSKQLHQFLREEEEARVAALKEEEEQKRKMILLEKKNIKHHISSLSAVEELLQKDRVTFLTSDKRSWNSFICSGSDPHLLPGGLLDEAKHLGDLAHRVWGNVEKRITFTPVILDPNTASAWLSLSDDLTSVRNEGTKSLTTQRGSLGTMKFWVLRDSVS